MEAPLEASTLRYLSIDKELAHSQTVRMDAGTTTKKAGRDPNLLWLGHSIRSKCRYAREDNCELIKN